MASVVRIKKISPLQLGKMLAVIYGLLSLIIVPFFLVFSGIAMFAGAASGAKGFAPAALGAGVGLIFILFLPVLYACFGFIGGALGALVYNLVAKWVGGIEIEVEQ